MARDVRIHNGAFERPVRLVDYADVRVEGPQVQRRRGLHVDFDWYTHIRYAILIAEKPLIRRTPC